MYRSPTPLTIAASSCVAFLERPHALAPLFCRHGAARFGLAGQVGYVFGKGGHTLADVKSKAGVNIITDVSREASLPPPSLSHTNW